MSSSHEALLFAFAIAVAVCVVAAAAAVGDKAADTAKAAVATTACAQASNQTPSSGAPLDSVPVVRQPGTSAF